MTTKFAWKRKIGEKVSIDKSTEFESQSKDEDTELDGVTDWLTLMPKRSRISLEDGIAKSERLKNEGITLAEAGRNWEAVKKWDEALIYRPDNETIHEMKAQVFIELHEVVQAVLSARRAVEIKPCWWVAHQTLGRAHLAVGDVNLAKYSFIQAIFLNPTEKELWDEDLQWALTLLQRKREMDEIFEKQTKLSEQTNQEATLTEINDETENETETDDGNHGNSEENRLDIYTADKEWKQCNSMNTLPQNYVLMR